MSSLPSSPSAPPASRPPLRLGFIGAGSFLRDQFAEVFALHPGIGDIYVADLELTRAEHLVRTFGFAGACRTLDELLALGVDAVAIFTPRHTHAPIAIQAMKAGCHVYLAVPAAVTLDELARMTAVSAQTRRVCMTGETSYYYPESIYCRAEFATGRWGKFIYAEAQYMHDMTTWGPHFRLTYGDDWKRYAAIPPFHYATHSFSMPLSITNARVTHISGQGFVDTVPDSGYGPGANPWDNPFSNEVSLARTSDGGSIRIGEFRRLGWFPRNSSREVMMPHFYCTDACFEENSVSRVLLARTEQPDPDNLNWNHHSVWEQDLSPWLDCPYFISPRPDVPEDARQFLGLAPAHAPNRLPDEFRGLKSGHNGSHQFLVDDFVRAAREGCLPPCHIWASAKWCAPGLVAHESALQGGVLLPVPDFGEAPSDWPLLTYPDRPDDALRPTPPALK